MKTWTNLEIEELEVELTAGGVPFSWTEYGFPGIFDVPSDDEDKGDLEDGKDETTDGQS